MGVGLRPGAKAPEAPPTPYRPRASPRLYQTSGWRGVPELPAAARGGASQTVRPRNVRPSAAAARDGFGAADGGDELAAPLGRPGLDAGFVAAEVGGGRPPTGVEAEASSRPGTGAAVTGPNLEDRISSLVRGPSCASAPR